LTPQFEISRRLAAAGVLALILSALLNFACARAATPRLSISPASAAPGASLQVNGSGFTPKARVSLTWDGAALETPDIVAGPGGAFSASVGVPAGATTGAHVLTASARTLRASATAQITAAAPTPTPTPTPPATQWKPAVNTSWQIQYSGTLDTSLDVTLYNIDGFDTPAATVAALHAAGHKVACYFSAGAWEDWRPDAADYPASVLGTSNGWPGEKWLDIRQLDVLGPLIDARMDMCQAKGFDAVDPDNVDGYTNTSGFPLTAADQLAFNRYVAQAAHARGLAVGLKNDGDQAQTLVNDFDFAVVEQCFEYDECDIYAPFIAAGKPVFEIEYELDTSDFCADANALNFNALKKDMDLTAQRVACR
jgi:hypothetical protein